MTAFFGIRYAWPSALLIYWLVSNVIAIFQQIFVCRKLDPASKEIVFLTTSPRWIRVVMAYAQFLLGRGYSPDVRISLARWMAWSFITSSTFLLARYGFVTAYGAADHDALNLLINGVTATSILVAVMRLKRGSVAGF